MPMITERYAEADFPAGSAGAVLSLIRSGSGGSRSALARATGLSPSTIGLRVEALQRLGLVTEAGEHASRGGRRARRLTLVRDAGFVAAIDLGAHHLKIAVADLAGDVRQETQHPGIGGRSAPEVVDLIWSEVNALAHSSGLGSATLRGIAISLPAPIEHPSGRIVSPSFMPSWHDVNLTELFAHHTDAPVLVENDANLVALAEAAASPQRDHLLAVILGTRIGSGIIAGGSLQRGFSGAAGEISHTSANGEPSISCVCGVGNCLESVASGGALIARLNALGYPVESTADVVEAGRGADPRVTSILREAGAQIGSVLAGIVNFINPRYVVLSGSMSASTPLVAAIRAELFQRCLPIATNDLVVTAVDDPATACLRGALHLILEEALAPMRIDEELRRATEPAEVPAVRDPQ